MEQRLLGLRNSGWIQARTHGHNCPRGSDGNLPRNDLLITDIGDLSTVDWRHRDHFRGLYIHKHLDDPSIEIPHYKNIHLPSWWWIVSNKESS